MIFELNGRLGSALMDSLDRIIANTRTNEEWDAYWETRHTIERVYNIKIGTTQFNWSDDDHRTCHHWKKRCE